MLATGGGTPPSSTALDPALPRSAALPMACLPGFVEADSHGSADGRTIASRKIHRGVRETCVQYGARAHHGAILLHVTTS